VKGILPDSKRILQKRLFIAVSFCGRLDGVCSTESERTILLLLS
jgi:hypothetical protein